MTDLLAATERHLGVMLRVDRYVRAFGDAPDLSGARITVDMRGFASPALSSVLAIASGSNRT